MTGEVPQGMVAFVVNSGCEKSIPLKENKASVSSCVFMLYSAGSCKD